MCKYMFYICDTVYILYHYIFKYKVHMYIQIILYVMYKYVHMFFIHKYFEHIRKIYGK